MRYGITWIWKKEKHSTEIDTSVEDAVYSWCKELEASGVENITIYKEGALFDHYIQGRSTRDVPSVPDTFRQLDLF
tara:strand:+ start:136 stop:363 length:228 start_codon:yes stop_codon:yes gene_type:complete